MGALQPPDAFEQIAVDSILDRDPEIVFGRTFWRMKRFTWGEGPDPNTGKWSAGQRYAVDIVLEVNGSGGDLHLPGNKIERVRGAVVAVMPLLCVDAQQDALESKDHRHDDVVCRYANHPDTPVHRAWQFLSARDAVLAALRWDPENEVEPFGWHRALDGSRRIRPGGDPMLETTGADALERRSE